MFLSLVKREMLGHILSFRFVMVFALFVGLTRATPDDPEAVAAQQEAWRDQWGGLPRAALSAHGRRLAGLEP